MQKKFLSIDFLYFFAKRKIKKKSVEKMIRPKNRGHQTFKANTHVACTRSPSQRSRLLVLTKSAAFEDEI